jgi:hypothetical protein
VRKKKFHATEASTADEELIFLSTLSRKLILNVNVLSPSQTKWQPTQVFGE